jgi:hypothetical protein
MPDEVRVYTVSGVPHAPFRPLTKPAVQLPGNRLGYGAFMRSLAGMARRGRERRAACDARSAPEKFINLDAHWAMLLEISRTIEFFPLARPRESPGLPRRGFLFAKRRSVVGRLPRRAAPLFPAHSSATARRAPTVRAAS